MNVILNGEHAAGLERVRDAGIHGLGIADETQHPTLIGGVDALLFELELLNVPHPGVDRRIAQELLPALEMLDEQGGLVDGNDLSARRDDPG